MMFPTTNTFCRYENEGLFKSIKEATTVSGIKVRIMVYLDNQKTMDMISQDYAQEKHIRILTLQKPKLQSKVISMIIDNEFSLVIDTLLVSSPTYDGGLLDKIPIKWNDRKFMPPLARIIRRIIRRKLD